MNWFAVFLYLWAAGISGALAFLPADALGRRFFRFHAVILLVLGIAATAIARPFFDGIPRETLGLLAAAIAWALFADIVVIAALAFSKSRPIVPTAFLLPVITGGFLAVTLALKEESGRPAQAALLTAHLLTSGALLGSVLVAMNLGHSYLQNAALSFDHLARLARLFLGTAIAKAVVTAALLAPEVGRWWPQLLDTLDGMLILARVVAGLGGSIGLAWMTLSCARSKANQSATGILYAATVIVLIGEGISMYLTLGRGIRA
ncbi:MAG TPA: hypothetical protein VFS19_01545 [Planctomycetota bacterium]|nr:hypothetical protein [Planctomycetota bacterium]